MKKLLLLPLVAIGLALVPAKQADAQVSVGIGGVGVGFGYPGYRYGLRIPGIWVLPAQLLQLLRRLSILPNVLLHWATVLLQTAIELTSIISIITTATKADGWCEGNWLAWSNSKPAFFCLKPNHPPVRACRSHGQRTKCAKHLARFRRLFASVSRAPRPAERCRESHRR